MIHQHREIGAHCIQQTALRFLICFPLPHYVAVYKALEQRHADLVMRFLNINDERSIDTASDLIDTFKYIPTMLKHSLGIMCALTDYTHKNWSATDTKKE